MDLSFYKYQGTGNDFILLEDKDGDLERFLTKARIAHLCDRHMGIGADGLILLQKTGGYDFRMVYYNSDGGESTFCGNGSRCLVAFAYQEGWISNEAWFVASDGDHEARVLPDGRISVHMRSVRSVTWQGNDGVLDTGSPHYVRWVDDVKAVNILQEAHHIRYGAPWKDEGINVNFVESTAKGLLMRTYERGVENETLSCGTGVTAAAIAWADKQTLQGHHIIGIETPGGQLEVSLEAGSYGYREIWLTGPAQIVFKGNMIVY